MCDDKCAFDLSDAHVVAFDAAGIPPGSCVARGREVIVACAMGNTCRMQSSGLNALCVAGTTPGAVSCGAGFACESPCACVPGRDGICDCNGQTAAP